ncbi:hypothetical protein ACA30_00735 [Virgibacillus soli]|nr:hypothetical protein ACA30_00735 [Virgibacillus soli]
MKKYMMLMAILFVSGFLLMACGNDNDKKDADNTAEEQTSDNENRDIGANIPDEVVKDADADPIELENQMGLTLGETGYAISQSENFPLAATLNSVEKTQDIGSETRKGDEFYLIADFTFENLGDSHLKVEMPDVASGSEESAIVNDEITKGDRLGLGSWFLDEDGNIDKDNPTNSLSLEPGEEATHKIALSMRNSADEYIIYFGFFASHNRDYQNKAAWTVPADQVNEK